MSRILPPAPHASFDGSTDVTALAQILSRPDAAVAVLLLGPVGSGKTRLARELGVEQAGIRRGHSVWASVRDGATAAIEAVASGLGAACRPQDLDEVVQGDPGATLTVVEALARSTRTTARSAPLTLVIDDLDQAPQWLWTMLGLLLERTRAVAWRVLLCARDSWPEMRVRQGLAPLPEWVVSYQVAPLSTAGVAELLAEHGAGFADEQLLATVAASLGTAAGNPGSVIDLVRGLRSADRLLQIHGRVYLRDPTTALTLPEDSPQLLRTRLLNPAIQAVFAAVCATGGVEVNAVRHISRAMEASADEVATAVDDLVRAGLLVERSGVVRAAVPAVGQVAAAGCPAAVRQLLARSLVPGCRARRRAS